MKQPPIFGAGTPSLWAGVLGVPALWGAKFQLMYSLVPWVCKHQKVWLLHLATAVSLALGTALLVIALIDYRKTFREQSDSLESGPHARGRFLGALGLLTASLFLLLMFAQGVPSFFIDPCSD